MSTQSDTIETRVKEVAKYIINEHATVRMAAKKFGVSKSTVHKDIRERLQNYSTTLTNEANKILDENKAERSYRGGLATRQKYLALKNL